MKHSQTAVFIVSSKLYLNFSGVSFAHVCTQRVFLSLIFGTTGIVKTHFVPL